MYRFESYLFIFIYINFQIYIAIFISSVYKGNELNTLNWAKIKLIMVEENKRKKNIS